MNVWVCFWNFFTLNFTVFSNGPDRKGNSGNSVRLYFFGPKITADGNCSHEIKRCLLLGRKVMTKLDSIFSSVQSLSRVQLFATQ